MQNFKETGSTINEPLSGRPRTSQDPEKVERVRASVREQTGYSTRKQSSILNVLRTSLNRTKICIYNCTKTNMGQHVTPPWCSVCEIFGYPKEVTLTGQQVARTYPQWILFFGNTLKVKS